MSYVFRFYCLTDSYYYIFMFPNFYTIKSSNFLYFNSIAVNFNCSITDFVPLSDDPLEEYFNENIDFDVYKDVLTVPFTGRLNPAQYRVWRCFKMPYLS